MTASENNNNKRIKQLPNNILRILKNNMLVSVLLLIYVCFPSLFLKLINCYIVNPFISRFEDSWATVLLFFLGIVSVMYIFGKRYINRKLISDNEVYYATIVLVFWIYYRLYNPYWDYIVVGNISFVTYIDILFLYAFLVILSKIFYKEKLLTVNKDLGLLSDNAIKEDKQDKLGRVNIASDLAIKITNTKTEKECIAIGIVAPWGYGKTSFLNLLEPQLRKNGAEIIRFNPWCFEKEKSLTNAFFTEIRTVLKKYNPELSTTIKDYAEIISNVDDSRVKTISNLLQGGTNEKDFNSTFKLIDDTIEKIGKHIIIYIDDLDRLDKDEISDILKLIRNTANFKNVVYICAYDRNYLINAIRQINSYQSPIYLEKIFQFEFTLPDYDSIVLKKQLFELSKDFVIEEDSTIFSKALFSNTIFNVGPDFVSEHIHSMRDVKRFVNAFRVTYERLKGNVDIVDLMNVELLHIKFPSIYDLMVSKWKTFLTYKNDYESTQLVLWSIDIAKQRKDASNEIRNINFKEYVTNNATELGLERNNIDAVMNIVNALFPTFGSSKNNLKRINNSEAIRRYFYYSLLDTDLSESDFKELWELPYDKIISKIDELLINKSRSLTSQIANYIPTGIEEYKTITKVIFYIGRESTEHVNGYEEISRFLSMNSFFNSDELFKKYVIELLHNNWDNEFALKYLNQLYKHLSWNFILSKEEVIELNFTLFQKHIIANESISRCLYFLYYTTYIHWEPTESRSFKEKLIRNKDADKLFIDYAKKNLNELFVTLISINRTNNKLFFIENYAKEIWGTWENFEQFIDGIEHKDSATVEFLEFLKLCKKSNYSGGVAFEFKEINFSI